MDTAEGDRLADLVFHRKSSTTSRHTLYKPRTQIVTTLPNPLNCFPVTFKPRLGSCSAGDDSLIAVTVVY